MRLRSSWESKQNFRLENKKLSIRMMRPFSKYPLLMLAFILLAMRPAAVAQLDATLYHMSTIPQVKYTNPASSSDYKWYIGLPGISSIYANVHHNGFVVADLLKK
ncbi:MAG TPA: hypothetical protein EYN71_00020, partial [Flavobacteriales bacterium]|nr:hypothetical protein [Flavobacteriales bacterium]